jgi:hypothetical protein
VRLQLNPGNNNDISAAMAIYIIATSLLLFQSLLYSLKYDKNFTLTFDMLRVGVRGMMFNATLNNISDILWRPVLLVE